MPKNHSINRERVLVVRENRWLRIWQGLGLLALAVALPLLTFHLTRLELGEDFRALQKEMGDLRGEGAQNVAFSFSDLETASDHRAVAGTAGGVARSQ